MKRILYSTLLLAACAAEPPPPSPAAPPQPPPRDEEEQGRYLLGRFADALAGPLSHVSVTAEGDKDLELDVVVSVVGDELVATHGDGTAFSAEDFEGMVFADGPVQLRIDAVDTMPDTLKPGYALSYSLDGITWQDYCDSGLDSHAVPMQGTWTIGRKHQNDLARITFGCFMGGVTAKCIDWGYSPGTKGSNDSQWQLHQTCAQFASGDYCNKGVAHTRELTPIAIRDYVPGLKPAPTDTPTLPTLDPAKTWPPPDDFFLEGAWQYNGPVICLSKVRWAALPPGGFCPLLLPDPREGGGGVFCDDLTFTSPAYANALYFTGSKAMDIYSHTWFKAGDLLTTVEGYVEDGVAISKPFPGEGYQLVPNGQSYILLRNLPGSIELADVVPVFLQRHPTTLDTVVAPIDGTHLVGYTIVNPRPEGYLVTLGGANLVPLKLFHKGSDYVTALTAPPGYTHDVDYDRVLLP